MKYSLCLVGLHFYTVNLYQDIKLNAVYGGFEFNAAHVMLAM